MCVTYKIAHEYECLVDVKKENKERPVACFAVRAMGDCPADIDWRILSGRFRYNGNGTSAGMAAISVLARERSYPYRCCIDHRRALRRLERLARYPVRWCSVFCVARLRRAVGAFRSPQEI